MKPFDTGSPSEPGSALGYEMGGTPSALINAGRAGMTSEDAPVGTMDQYIARSDDAPSFSPALLDVLLLAARAEELERLAQQTRALMWALQHGPRIAGVFGGGVRGWEQFRGDEGGHARIGTSATWQSGREDEDQVRGGRMTIYDSHNRPIRTPEGRLDYYLGVLGGGFSDEDRERAAGSLEHLLELLTDPFYRHAILHMPMVRFDAPDAIPQTSGFGLDRNREGFQRRQMMLQGLAGGEYLRQSPVAGWHAEQARAEQRQTIFARIMRAVNPGSEGNSDLDSAYSLELNLPLDMGDPAEFFGDVP